MRIQFYLVVSVAFLAAGLFMFPAVAPAAEAASNSSTGDPYVLDTCPVSGGKLGSMGEPVVRVYDGREVRFCCAGCPPKFEANAGEYWEKIDAQIVAQQSDSYPLDTCLVSGEKLGGAMGDPIDYVHGNRLIRFCCKGCIKEFEKDPGAFTAKLDAAVIERQQESYPLTTCVVSGEPLDAMGEPIDAVYANQLVRFCCKGCAKEFENAPAAHLNTIHEARKDAAS